MQYKKLNEIAVLLNGYSFKSREYVDSGIRVIRIANVQDGYIADEQPCFYPMNTEGLARYMLKEGDLLISLTGNVGKVGLVPATMLPAALNQRVSCIRLLDDRILLEFLFFYLRRKEFIKECTRASKGVAQLNLSTKWLEDYLIPVPPLAEQERIVSRIEELFSQLDAGIDALKKTKAQLGVYRQAVLKEAFEGKLTERWRRNHIYELTNLLEIIESLRKNNRKTEYQLESEITLPNLPERWKWAFIGDISKGPEYGTSKKSLKAGKIPVLRMGNIQNGVFQWGDLVFSDDDSEIEKYKLTKGDVLFNRTNSPELVGKTAVYRGEREAIFAGYLIRINQLDCINSEYLTYYMNSFIPKIYGNKVKTDGVNQSNINGKKLCSFPFPLCSIEEQKQIVYELENRLSVCDSIEQTVEASLQQSESLRQSILKEAFEGRL